MKRIIIPNAETHLATIQDAISQTRDIRYFHRLEVVRYVLQGHSPCEAAQVFNHSPRSIHNWLHRLAQKYSVTLGVRRCQKLFHELGLSLQRPRQQAVEAKPSQQEVFKKIFSANTRPQRPAMV